MPAIYGTNVSETIDAADGVTNGVDVIHAYYGNDKIFGLGGDDVIHGGDGADDIHGGEGSDYSSYEDSTTGVIVSLNTGLGYSGDAEGDTLTSIENLTGSKYGDELVGNDGQNTLNGLGGNDILKGGGGADKLYGDGNDDILKGGGGADKLYGGEGIDTASYIDSNAGVRVSLGHGTGDGGDAEGDTLVDIENLTGSDYADNLWGNDSFNTLKGEDGNDTLNGYGGQDKLYGGDDDDLLYGMDGVDTLYGEAGNDTLNGGANFDTMFGGTGNDILDGGTGNDAMTGGTGNDNYYVDSATDVVTELAGGGQGTDTVFSSANAYTLAANVETLSLDTGTSAVYGTGNAQANTIYGNVNDNVLEGGGGADTFNGLGGNDNFVFRPGDANGDVIHAFEGNGAAVGDFMYFIGYGTVAEGASFQQLDATTWQINSADGLTHDTITFAGGPAIDAGDFVFV